MKISKKDALMWFQFFAQMPEDEQLFNYQQEIVYAVLSQIELAEEARQQKLLKNDLPTAVLKSHTAPGQKQCAENAEEKEEILLFAAELSIGVYQQQTGEDHQE